MNRITTLLFALTCGCAFVPQGAFASTAPWVKMGSLPGSDAGRIAFDPNNPNTMLIGAQAGSGIIFRSTNGGASFTPIQVGTIYEAFRAIAFDPKKGSGLAFAVSADFATGQNAAVYKSTTGGASWSRLANQPVAAGSTGPSLIRSRVMAVDPTGTILVVGDSKHGLYYSGNLGGSWTNPIPKANIFGLTADPNQPSTLWAGGVDRTSGAGVLWKSTNFGKSWTEISVPVLNQNLGPAPSAIAILPGTKTIVFAWFGTDSNNNFIGGVVASKDGGSTWAASGKGLPSDFTPGNSLVVDPTTPTTLYLTTNRPEYPNGFFRSIDSGASWVSIGNVIGGGDGVFTAAARPAVGSVPAAVFAADEDLILSTNHGASWTVLADGTNSGILTQAADDLLATGGLYASTYNGLFHSTNNGQSWTRISAPWTGATVPRAFAVDPVAAAHTVYAATGTGFWRSTNAGKSWTQSTLPTKTSDIQALIADKSVAGRVYAVDSNRSIYRSDDGGISWNAGSGVGSVSDSFQSTPPVLADPAQGGILYAGMHSGIWKSINSAGSWSETKAVPNLASLAAITQPGGTEILAVVGQSTTSGFNYVLQKGLGGTNLAAAANPYPANGGTPFFLAAGKSGPVFAYGLDNSLMRSTDNAGSWSVIDGPIEPSIVTTMAVSVTRGSIYVSDNFTDSAFTAPLASLTASTPAIVRARTKPSVVRSGQAPRHIPE